MPEQSTSRSWGNFYLLGLLIVTFIFRLSGIFWGIPPADTGYYHPDEPKLAYGAYRFPADIVDRLDLRYPTGMHSLVGLLTWPAKTLSATMGIDSYLVVYLGGRVISVLMGTATVMLVYLLARKRYGQLAGLAAASALAFSLLHVTNSSWVTTDVATSFFLALFLLLLIVTLERRSIWWALAAGSALGMLMGTKYTGALALIPLMILVFDSHRPLNNGSLWRSLWDSLTDPRLWAIGIAAGLVFLASTPATLAHPKAFLLSLRQEQVRLALDRLPLYRPENWLHAGYSTVQAIGLPLALAALAGLLLSLLLRRGAFEIALSALVAGFYLYFGHALLPRYVILIMPALVLLATYPSSLALASQHIRVRQTGMLACAAVLLFSFGYTLFGVWSRYPDARTLASNYIRENIPARVTLGIAYSSEDYDAWTHPWRYPKIEFDRFRETDFLKRPKYVIVTSYDSDTMRELLAYIAAAPKSARPADLANEFYKGSPPNGSIIRFWQELYAGDDSPYELVASFRSHRLQVPIEFPSPTIEIYKRRPEANVRMKRQPFGLPELRNF